MTDLNTKVLAESLANGVFCTVRELFYEGLKAKDVDLHRISKARAMAGSKRSKMRGRGMEFFESRPYVPQDEMRTIDWKVSARLSKLYTKVFVEERDRPVYLVVDLRPSMFFGSRHCFKSVLAARIAAQLATAAINGGDQLSGLIFDGFYEHICPLGGSRRNLAGWFGILSEGTKRLLTLHRTGRLQWPLVLRNLASRCRSGAQVFLLSDFLDVEEDLREVLFKLEKKAQVFALSLFDPLEEHMPELGRVGMVFNQERVVFDSDERELKRKYQAWWQGQQSKISTIFGSMGIPHMRFSTADEPNIQLRSLLRSSSAKRSLSEGVKVYGQI